MVLSFALCATFAFAQVKTAKNLTQRQNNVASVSVPSMSQVDYKASIFTKDEEVLRTWDFSAPNAGFSFNVIDATRAAAYTNSEVAFVHSANEAFAEWNYIAGVDSATLANAATLFSTLNSFMFGGNMVGIMPRYMDTAECSSANGFAMTSLLGIADYSGVPVDSYIEFDPIDLSAEGVYDVSFYQLYCKFYDHCYVDYSIDNGAHWKTIEINRSGVDVATSTIYGSFFTYTLPQEAKSASTKLRLRYAYSGLAPSGNPWQYAYFWAVDDFSVIRGEANRWKGHDQCYSEGAYQMMPKGLELPIYWNADIENNGLYAKPNVNVTINSINMAGTDTHFVDTYNNGNIDPEEVKTVMVDGLGRRTLNGEQDGWYGESQGIVRGEGNGVYVEEEGEYFVQAKVSSDTNKLVYRGIYYIVNDMAADSTLIWSHDNGVLTNKSAYTFGFVEPTTYSHNAETYMDAGYEVTLRYTTGPNIPTDENGEPWVIRGVEYVPGTTPSKLMGINHITPVLMSEEFDSSSVRFNEVVTGVTDVTVDANEYVDSAELLARGYMEYGEYPVVTVYFPEQPELEANASYYLGYQLAQSGAFTLATSAGNTYYQADPSTTSGVGTRYFSQDSTIAYLGTTFVTGATIPNGYDLYLQDGVVERGYSWPGFYTDYYPAIRMLVGPRRNVPQFTINATCEFDDNDSNYGGVYGPDRKYACGSELSYNQGSSIFYYIQPAEGCSIKSLEVDGVQINAASTDPNLEVLEGYWLYHFNNMAANHTIKAKFGFEIGIDPVAANVRMNLQPNPATSQVKLSIEGVNGMVNCSLVDMSGRVVYNTNINAENAETINVSNLAKGAYFVRITNNDFTKVEKLIVR